MYIEADKDDKGEYFKDYNYGNPNKILWDSTHKKKYSFCLEPNLILKNSFIKDYQIMKFYNDKDDGPQTIDTFVNHLKNQMKI